MPKLIRRLAAAALAAAVVFTFPVVASAAEDGGGAPSAVTQAAHTSADPTPPGGYQTGHFPETDAPAAPRTDAEVAAWSYHITASCSGYEGAIRQGANFWGEANETPSSGTPVECTGGYVPGCGISNAVGCNWGMGDRIMLSTMVSDFALLSAHEFGHNWYGHSPAGCANWASAYEVMRPTMC
ncbi:hypothetical protein DVA86_22395 [Streptomyces armeniacus]|uniref:Uncharacterized protein n=1 Tax=Streptomyces armeniacus TaxID=83291 RepID=A0A345XTL9_9ACTN|nr:hypothetical protein [Streptomyces armeniacus]AXK34985.1 hypothetical protein DVA86_22395 [Streptomyces armeniacus]